jgi:hypothetical protein
LLKVVKTSGRTTTDVNVGSDWQWQKWVGVVPIDSENIMGTVNTIPIHYTKSEYNTPCSSTHFDNNQPPCHNTTPQHQPQGKGPPDSERQWINNKWQHLSLFVVIVYLMRGALTSLQVPHCNGDMATRQ